MYLVLLGGGGGGIQCVIVNFVNILQILYLSFVEIGFVVQGMKLEMKKLIDRQIN